MIKLIFKSSRRPAAKENLPNTKLEKALAIARRKEDMVFASLGRKSSLRGSGLDEGRSN